MKFFQIKSTHFFWLLPSYNKRMVNNAISRKAQSLLPFFPLPT